jgi:hypothetical protein
MPVQKNFGCRFGERQTEWTWKQIKVFSYLFEKYHDNLSLWKQHKYWEQLSNPCLKCIAIGDERINQMIGFYLRLIRDDRDSLPRFELSENSIFRNLTFDILCHSLKFLSVNELCTLSSVSKEMRRYILTLKDFPFKSSKQIRLICSGLDVQALLKYYRGPFKIARGWGSDCGVDIYQSESWSGYLSVNKKSVRIDVVQKCSVFSARNGMIESFYSPIPEWYFVIDKEHKFLECDFEYEEDYVDSQRDLILQQFGIPNIESILYPLFYAFMTFRIPKHGIRYIIKNFAKFFNIKLPAPLKEWIRTISATIVIPEIKVGSKNVFREDYTYDELVSKNWYEKYINFNDGEGTDLPLDSDDEGEFDIGSSDVE